MESKIQHDTAYQKQQETLIVWSEGENYDLALSFQEKAGCDEIWEKICQVRSIHETFLVFTYGCSVYSSRKCYIYVLALERLESSVLCAIEDRGKPFCRGTCNGLRLLPKKKKVTQDASSFFKINRIYSESSQNWTFFS